MTLTTSPLTRALAAVERALVEYGVTPVRHSISSSLCRLEYLAGQDSLAALGWGDGLQFFEDELTPQVFSLIASHARLTCADPHPH